MQELRDIWGFPVSFYYGSWKPDYYILKAFKMDATVVQSFKREFIWDKRLI
jgi:hypothetical protein